MFSSSSSREYLAIGSFVHWVLIGSGVCSVKSDKIVHGKNIYKLIANVNKSKTMLASASFSC